MFRDYPHKNLFHDPSLWLLLLSNIATIFFAIIGNWNLLTIMWVYWFQSIIIGFFSFIRILQTKKFSTQKLQASKQTTLPPSPQMSPQNAKIFVAFFFLFHYGLFHFVYLISLLVASKLVGAYGSAPSFVELKYIFLAALFFFINHLFSYLYNRLRDTKEDNIGSLMLRPYARIIPMHVTIMFGSVFGGALIIFLLIKTFADAVMHILEHNVFYKSRSNQ